MQIQMYLIYSILGGWLLLGTILRPFKTGQLNFLRSLSDLTLLVYFISIHLNDNLLRNLDPDLTESELQNVANSQIRLGYLGMGL